MAGLAIDNVILVYKLRPDLKYAPLKVHVLTAI